MGRGENKERGKQDHVGRQKEENGGSKGDVDCEGKEKVRGENFLRRRRCVAWGGRGDVRGDVRDGGGERGGNNE